MTQLIVWLNAVSNACAGVLLAPIAALPGWLSATLVAAVTGVLMLVVFKHTSNQRAIKRARAEIKANLLAVSLFKDSTAVSVRSLGHVLIGAGQLLTLAIVPMAIMAIPMTLLLGQLALWYEARPLRVEEEAVVTMKLADSSNKATAAVRLSAQPEFAITVGPVRVPSKQMVCWNVQVRQPGRHTLRFELDGKQYAKEFVAGDDFAPVSLERPAWAWPEALRHPREAPFPPDSPVQSIDIAYPPRVGWTCGSGTWLIYWFAASMVAALAAKPILKVNL